MKYSFKVFLSFAFFLMLGIGGYHYISKLRLIPKKVKNEFVHSIVRKNQLIKMPYVKGKCLYPSVLAQENGFLSSYILQYKERYKLKNWQSKEKLNHCLLCLFQLDDNLQPLVTYERLQLKNASGIPLFNVTEASLISFNNGVYLVYADRLADGSHDMYIGRIHRDGNTYQIRSPKLLRCKEWAHQKAHWTPYVLNGQLRLHSHTHPLRHVQVDIHSGQCLFVASTPIENAWPYGTIYAHASLQKTEYGTIGIFHSTQEVDRIFTHNDETFPVHFLGALQLDDALQLSHITQGPLYEKRLYSSLMNRKKLANISGSTYKNGHLIVSYLLGETKPAILCIPLHSLNDVMKPINSLYGYGE